MRGAGAFSRRHRVATVRRQFRPPGRHGERLPAHSLLARRNAAAARRRAWRKRFAAFRTESETVSSDTRTASAPGRRRRKTGIARESPGPNRRGIMNVVLVRSRYFGAAVLDALQTENVAIVRVVVPAADDRLANAARDAGLDVFGARRSRRSCSRETHVADGTDLIVTAHSACAHKQRRAGTRSLSGRHRLPSVAVAAPSRASRRSRWTIREARSASPVGTDLSSGRPDGRPAQSPRRSGVSSKRRERRASCGNARWRPSASIWFGA